jgi:hypothetical protein
MLKASFLSLLMMVMMSGVGMQNSVAGILHASNGNGGPHNASILHAGNGTGGLHNAGIYHTGSGSGGPHNVNELLSMGHERAKRLLVNAELAPVTVDLVADKEGIQKIEEANLKVSSEVDEFIKAPDLAKSVSYEALWMMAREYSALLREQAATDESVRLQTINNDGTVVFDPVTALSREPAEIDGSLEHREFTIPIFGKTY